MQEKTLVETRAYELKKLVSILEWDIPHIKNSNLRAMKEKKLMECKHDLQELLKIMIPQIEEIKQDGGSKWRQ